eukprot:m.113662 g.113662  ORF g.113662 m.113662 type:complete len:589 (-) comp14141_c0_seq2:304-2070(-)
MAARKRNATRSKSAIERNIRQLGKDICDKKRVVFVTGAGLSVASGIPAYRTGENATWSHVVTRWGTRQCFLEDPVEWWKIFYERKVFSFTQKQPNQAHDVIAQLTAKFPNVKVITQNVDNLHRDVPSYSLIEMHGRANKFKCVSDGCVFASTKSVDNGATESCVYNEDGLPPQDLSSVPRCPECNQPVLPQFLCFDEMYESHEYYQWTKALKWMAKAEAFVFLGTSLAVNGTEEALKAARKHQATVYSINSDRVVKLDRWQAMGVTVHHILASAVDACIALDQFCRSVMNTNSSDLPCGKRQKVSHDEQKLSKGTSLYKAEASTLHAVRQLIEDHARHDTSSPLGVLDKISGGEVHVDSLQQPTVCVIEALGGFWTICGVPQGDVECTDGVVAKVVEFLSVNKRWDFLYSHPNSYWSPRLRQGLGALAIEFKRNIYTCPETPPSENTLRLPTGYTAKNIETEALFERYAKCHPWFKVVWPQYESFKIHGIGTVACAKNGRVIAGATSAYVGGINGVYEIDIFTSPSCRQKGIATFLAAKLMILAFHRRGNNTAPVSWTCDSTNAASYRTAEKLGFQLKGQTILFGVRE